MVCVLHNTAVSVMCHVMDYFCLYIFADYIMCTVHNAKIDINLIKLFDF